MTLKVEILRIDECPSWEAARSNAGKALDHLDIREKIEIIHIESEKAAIEEKFSGSPMIRAKGVDLFPVSGKDYGLRCRVFRVGEKFRGWPSKEMLIEALQEIL